MKLCVAIALAVLASSASAASAEGARQVGPWEWQGVARTVAVGDVHGTWRGLIEPLRGAGVLDRNDDWSGGETHVVVVGDFIDRNPADRAIMDLLRRLQAESAAAGGRVHVLLGNHEVMNLVRDLRYVSPAAYADFAADESEDERREAWRKFYAINRKLRVADARAAFDRMFPRGYFARLRAFDRDGKYGSWLVGLPAVVKVNGTVFVHGGLTERIAGLGLDGINRELHDELNRHLGAREILERQGIVTPLMDFSGIQDAAERVKRRRTKRSSQPEIREAADALLKLANSRMVDPQGPLWYRGNSLEDERIERLRLEQSLEALGAGSMVVAHSPTPTARITQRFGGLLLRVDHGIYEGNAPLALVLENGETGVLDPARGEFTPPPHDQPQGETWVGNRIDLSDRKMEQFLGRARVVDIRDLGRGSTRPQLLELEENGQSGRAIFKTVEETGPDRPGSGVNRYQHEVAAYLIDRELGLGLVPVTVARTVEGRRGSLQKWIEGAVDQHSLEEYGLPIEHEDELARQLALARVFDALIGNPDRTPSDVLWLAPESKVLLIDHSRAFPVDGSAADAAVEPPPELDAALRARMAALSMDSLADRLDGLLSERQIAAVLGRRDRILAAAGAPASEATQGPRP